MVQYLLMGKLVQEKHSLSLVERKDMLTEGLFLVQFRSCLASFPKYSFANKIEQESFFFFFFFYCSYMLLILVIPLENYKQRTDYKYTAHVSYLEIYNENGYDLLDPSHDTTALENLP